MNRTEIEATIKDLEWKQMEMREDLKLMGHMLSASSTLAIIIRLVNLKHEVDDYQTMLDMIKFEEITKEF